MQTRHVLRILIPLLIAVALAVGAAYAAWTWSAHDATMIDLDRSGAVTTGTVVGVTVSPGEKPTKYGNERPARYYITYRFSDASGAVHEAMTNGAGTYYSMLALGAPISIRYLPTDPSVSVYEHKGSQPGSSPITIIGLLLGLAAAVGWLAFRNFRRIAAKPLARGA
jgi:hypothetical protein